MYNLVVASEMISVFLRIDLNSLLIFVNKKKVRWKLKMMGEGGGGGDQWKSCPDQTIILKLCIIFI